MAYRLPVLVVCYSNDMLSALWAAVTRTDSDAGWAMALLQIALLKIVLSIFQVIGWKVQCFPTLLYMDVIREGTTTHYCAKHSVASRQLYHCDMLSAFSVALCQSYWCSIRPVQDAGTFHGWNLQTCSVWR